MDIVRSVFEHRGFELSYLDSAPGDDHRPVVLLLHGFPDTGDMWQLQIQALHRVGYRCIAPDTLGCGHSEIAPRVRDYNAVKIAGDHVALLDHLDVASAHVVGHDWGGMIAWFFAAYFPQRINRLVLLSMGHPTAYARAGFRQKQLGWYTFFFQVRGLAEWMLGGDGPLSLRHVFASHPNMDEVMARLRQPGRLKAALNIYRAAVVPVLLSKQPSVYANTLAIWSDADRFLTEDQLTNSRKFVEADWVYKRLEGGHWMSLEQPETINELIIGHLNGEHSSGPADTFRD